MSHHEVLGCFSLVGFVVCSFFGFRFGLSGATSGIEPSGGRVSWRSGVGFFMRMRLSRVCRTRSGVGGRRIGTVDAIRRCAYRGIYNTVRAIILYGSSLT